MKSSKRKNLGFWATLWRTPPFHFLAEELCAELCSMGVEARLTEHTRPQEMKRGRAIDIAGSPIRWINMLFEISSDPTDTIEYVIPDSGHIPPIQLQSKWVRTFPMFGSIIDVRWKGNDRGTGILQRLSSDDIIKASIKATCEVTIRGCPEHGCWLIVQKRDNRKSPVLKLKIHQWRSYERIAVTLLGPDLTPQRL